MPTKKKSLPTLKRLYLMRHAKAAKETHLDDASRPLQERGKQDAWIIGHVFKEIDFVPDVILCSSSVRTRQTLECIQDTFSTLPEILFLDELYLASQSQMISIIQNISDKITNVLIIGHNPSIQDTAVQLCDNPSSFDATYALMKKKFPTAGVALISLQGSWKKVSQSANTQLVGFVRPKELR